MVATLPTSLGLPVSVLQGWDGEDTGEGNYSVGEWLGSFWLLGFVCLKAPEKVGSVPLGCCPASVVFFFLILSCLWSQLHSLWQLEVKENFFPLLKNYRMYMFNCSQLHDNFCFNQFFSDLGRKSMCSSWKRDVFCMETHVQLFSDN